MKKKTAVNICIKVSDLAFSKRSIFYLTFLVPVFKVGVQLVCFAAAYGMTRE